LERYAAVFGAVEINTTFYKPHRASTFERWAGATPDDFAFCLKMPKTLTHELRLADCGPGIAAFLESAAPLSHKLKTLLIQLPPSLALDEAVAAKFFENLRQSWDGQAACEPRHATWFTPQGDALLSTHRIARVGADPVRAPGGDQPGGWPGFAYRRLHGSPRVYYSSYDEAYLTRLADEVAGDPPDSWCVFDNTTSGAAADNALTLQHSLQPS
jgi:uncharacterized protein YecE (DUF72 family)